MAPKRPAASLTEGGKPKKSRKAISLETKLEIVQRHERGEGTNSIARSFSLSASTISTVIKNSAKIKEASERTSSLQAKRHCKSREPIMERMENLLRMWIDEETRKHMPLSTALITAKALSIFEDLKVEMGVGDDVKFLGSKGWFEKFKNRGGLHSLKLTGEAASADTPAAEAFKPEFKDKIEEGGYTAKQTINFDETGLYPKKMSSKTFIAEEEKSAPGFKASKDRVTLVLGGNAEGDLKLKPMLVYHSENPRALKGYIKEYLPVIWKSNKKAWVTTVLTQSYVTSYLSPTLRDYAAKNNLANRFLLLLDNAPSHPHSMGDWCDNIEVAFLPPNTTSLIQPMDQGVIATFKAYYQRRTMKQLLDATDGPDKPTIKEFWKGYNIKNAIDNIAASWKEVSAATMNGCWKKLWPECVHGFEVFDGKETVSAVRKELVTLSHKLGFDEVDEDDVQELLDSHAEPLSTEELIQLEQEKAHQEDDDEEEPVRGLDLKTLREIFSDLQHIIDRLKEHDPNPSRSSTAAQSLEDSLKVYREMYNSKTKAAKQTVIHSFFKPAAKSSSFQGAALSPDDPSSAGPSTAGPSTSSNMPSIKGKSSAKFPAKSSAKTSAKTSPSPSQ